jgi:hypothetical protein
VDQILFLLWISRKFPKGGSRIKLPSDIYRPGDLLSYTLRGISRKYVLLLGQCVKEKTIVGFIGAHLLNP